MDPASIIESINKIINRQWKDNEVYEGKIVAIRNEWIKNLDVVITEYRRVGWHVKKEVLIQPNIRLAFLRFNNPYFKSSKY